MIGAGGSLGSRLIPALLAHGHTPIAYVRSTSKLTHILPPFLSSQIQVVEGDAEDVGSLKRALTEGKCDGLICVAGAPSPRSGRGPPSRQGYIGRAVAQAASEVGEERGKALRGWWLAGIIFMKVPGMGEKMFHEL